MPVAGPGRRPRTGPMTSVQVMRTAINAGFSLVAQTDNNRGGQDPTAVVATAVAYSENSTFRPGAVHRNSDGSLDVGLWQINQKSHPRWTVRQLKDPHTNAAAALSISSGGRDWSPWYAVSSKRYDRGLKIARRAARQIEKGFSLDELGAAQEIGPGKFADELTDAVTGLPEDIAAILKAIFSLGGDLVGNALEGLWPIMLKAALAGTGLALIVHGVKGLFDSGTGDAVERVAPIAAAAASRGR